MRNSWRLVSLVTTLAACGISTLIACGTSSTSTSLDPGSNNVDGSTGSREATSSPDANLGSSDAGGGTRADGEASADDTYMDGIYTCCGKNAGLTCCTADAGLLGYELLPDGNIITHGDRPGSTEANCFQYGGVINECTAEGDFLDRHDTCAICCPGLTPIDAWCGDGPCVETDSGDPPPLPSMKYCARCGDGQCGAGESHRNCPHDCP
jgi:hypothetical protein